MQNTVIFNNGDAMIHGGFGIDVVTTKPNNPIRMAHELHLTEQLKPFHQAKMVGWQLDKCIMGAVEESYMEDQG